MIEGTDIVLDWFYSKIEENDKQSEKLTALLEAADELIVFIKKPDIDTSSKAERETFKLLLEKYNSLKEQKG